MNKHLNHKKNFKTSVKKKSKQLIRSSNRVLLQNMHAFFEAVRKQLNTKTNANYAQES